MPAQTLALSTRVLHGARLNVVFDLDDTLVLALTSDSLAKRVSRARAARCAAGFGWGVTVGATQLATAPPADRPQWAPLCCC